MKRSLFTLLAILFATSAYSADILVTTSEPDAVIYVNGQQVGTGSATVVVPRKGKILVEAKKAGFFTADQFFYNMKDMAKSPKTYHFVMQEDDAFSASQTNTSANIDFAVLISEKINEADAWRIAVSIVTDIFDVIEVSDKETQYLRTSWQVNNFSKNTIRTRIIIKSGGKNTLKIKLVSEHSGRAGTSGKADDQFKEYDRVLNKYSSVISEFQNRLSDK